MPIRWRRRARADVNAIFEFLADRDPLVAQQIRDSIYQQVVRLADQPGLGRPGRVASTRELVVTGTPYIVPYTVDRDIDSVVILRVLHGAQRWPAEF